ncbi:2-nitropropane dioxygenase [Chytriomyces sp. MP71]|nr:2-nitropropane dioxygenase [Chytriomyces sp. MP71]
MDHLAYKSTSTSKQMSYLSRFPSRLRSVLPSLEIPIVQGPFGGGASTVALTAAVSNAGGLGSYGAHYLSPAKIRDLVVELRGAVESNRPFAVNLWVDIPHNDRANLVKLVNEGPETFEEYRARLAPYYKKYGYEVPEYPADGKIGHDFEEQVQALLDAAPPVISFVMGVPPQHVIAKAREKGIVTLGTATTVAEAVALQNAGIDAIVASGVEAGGHRGTFLAFDSTRSPPPDETTFTLVPRVRAAVKDMPVIAAGGVSTPEGVLAALTLGADAVQMGTAFVVADESGAAPVHKDAILDKRDAVARRTVLTKAFSGRQARSVMNGMTQELYSAESEIPGYPVQNYLTVPLRKKAGRIGDKDALVLWCGQAGTLVNGGGAADILKRLLTGVDEVVAKMKM